MAVFLVTYDVPTGTNYTTIHRFFEDLLSFRVQKSVWLLDTTLALGAVVANVACSAEFRGKVMVARLQRGEFSQFGCSCDEWLNHAERNW